GLAWVICWKAVVGSDVVKEPEPPADRGKIHDALEKGIIERVWPVGSKGIANEAERLFGRKLTLSADVDLEVSGGPASCVLMGVQQKQVESIKHHFGTYVYLLKAETPR